MEVWCGGDALNESLAENILKTCLALWNMYGPTETTIWSTTKKVVTPQDANVIGKPLFNTSLYVLGNHLQLLPIGAIGNLYIGGHGLAKGYHKNEALTDDRFISNPYEEGLIYENR